MTYAKHNDGEQTRFCRIKRRGPKNCRVVWLESDAEQLVARTELEECTPEEAGIEPDENESVAANEGSEIGPALSGEDLCRMMRNYQVTIQALATKLDVPADTVREARRNGLTDQLVAFEWQQAICGNDTDGAAAA